MARSRGTIDRRLVIKRFPVIEVLDEPQRVYANFIRGIASLPVRIPS
jgi:hypothetical protein